MMADEWKEFEPDEPILLLNEDGEVPAAPADAPAAGGAPLDPISSPHWTQRLLWGLSLGGAAGALWNALRYRSARDRLRNLSQAPCVTVEQIGGFWEKQQSQLSRSDKETETEPEHSKARENEWPAKPSILTFGSFGCFFPLLALHGAIHALQSSPSMDMSPTTAASSVFSPVPPAYVCLVGRSSCPSPLSTSFTPVPQSAIWLLHTSVRRCFKLWPLTTLKMFEQQQTESHCENRAFEIKPVGAAVAVNGAAASSAPSTAAGNSTLAAGAPSPPSLAPPSVFIPSSLPADSSHLLSLIQQVSDVTHDVHLSSSEFMKQLGAGLLHVQERNIERIVPVGNVITAFGWVQKDAQGRISMVGGNEQASASLQQALAGSPVTATTTSAAAAPSHLPSMQHDAASDLYSATHPAILSAHPPSRVLEMERASMGRLKTKLLLSAAVALLASLALAARFLYADYQRREQLRRILYYQQQRKLRKEKHRRERREREKRRESKKRAKAQAMEQELRHKAQAAYLQTTAAAPASQQPQQLEGVPQFGMRSTPSPLPFRAGAMQQHTPPQLARERGMPHSPAPLYPVGPGSSSFYSQQPLSATAASSSHSSSMQGQQRLAQQSMRAASPYASSSSMTPAEASSAYAPLQQPQLRRQASQPVSSSSAAAVSASSVVASHMHGAVDPAALESDEGSAGAGDASGASEDEDSPSAASGPEDGADDCVICAERKADACLVKCGHMYTCCTCARKLGVCPICRSPVERVVKVFAQTL